MLDIKWIILLSFTADESIFNIKLKSKLVFFSLAKCQHFHLEKCQNRMFWHFGKSISSHISFPSKNLSLIYYSYKNLLSSLGPDSHNPIWYSKAVHLFLLVGLPVGLQAPKSAPWTEGQVPLSWGQEGCAKWDKRPHGTVAQILHAV